MDELVEKDKAIERLSSELQAYKAQESNYEKQRPTSISDDEQEKFES